jgi:hypothetical protein
MRRPSLWLFALVVSGCATLTPDGARVSVYTARLDGPAANHDMPDGCRKLSESPKYWMSEQEMEGQAHPFAKQQNATAASGGNAVLALKKMVRPRLDFECPNAVPIRDCPGSSGAWFDVTFESYTCTAEALRTLDTPKGK